MDKTYPAVTAAPVGSFSRLPAMPSTSAPTTVSASPPARHGCTCLKPGELIDSFTPRRDDFL